MSVFWGVGRAVDYSIDNGVKFAVDLMEYNNIMCNVLLILLHFGLSFQMRHVGSCWMLYGVELKFFLYPLDEQHLSHCLLLCTYSLPLSAF